MCGGMHAVYAATSSRGRLSWLCAPLQRPARVPLSCEIRSNPPRTRQILRKLKGLIISLGRHD
jgi:hypothetical protein